MNHARVPASAKVGRDQLKYHGGIAEEKALQISNISFVFCSWYLLVMLLGSTKLNEETVTVAYFAWNLWYRLGPAQCDARVHKKAK